MKRTIIYLFTLLLLFSVAAVAQMTREPAVRNQGPTPRQSITDQRMGMRQGMGVMGRMQDRGMGMGMMNGDVMRSGNRRLGNRTITGSGDLLLNMSSRLELDDAQVEELKQIRLDLVRTTGDLETDLQVARIELQDLLDADEPDIDDIEKAISEIHEFEAKLETARLRARFDAQEVLTPEQLELVQGAQHRGRRTMREIPEE